MKTLLFKLWTLTYNCMDQLPIGNVLKIHFDMESWENNSKWYTDTKEEKIEVAGTGTQNIPDNTVNSNGFISSNEHDTLKF